MKRSYPCDVLQCHDGDTVTVRINLGFGISKTEKIRLYGPDADAEMGMNAPELNTSAGVTAATLLKTYLQKGGWVGRIETVMRAGKDKQEKFGRYLAVLFVVIDGKEVNLNQVMVSTGNAILREYALFFETSGDVIPQRNCNAGHVDCRLVEADLSSLKP